MPQVLLLQDEVARLQQCFGDLSRIVSERPADWRHRYLRFRREANAALGALCEAAASCPQAERDLRPLAMNLRIQITLHQAEWPVVDIDLDDASYVASRRNIEAGLARIVEVSRRLQTSVRSAA